MLNVIQLLFFLIKILIITYTQCYIINFYFCFVLVIGSDDDDSSTSATTAGILTTPNTINPLTKRVYTQRYHTLYKKRITLPVFEYRADFMRLLAENQCIVLVGEVNISIIVYNYYIVIMVFVYFFFSFIDNK